MKRHTTHPKTKWWTLQRPNVETRNWESNFPEPYINYEHICDPKMQNATIDLKASKNLVWHTNAVIRVINFKLATIIWIWFQLLDKRLVVIVRQPNTTNMPKKHATHILAQHLNATKSEVRVYRICLQMAWDSKQNHFDLQNIFRLNFKNCKLTPDINSLVSLVTTPPRSQSCVITLNRYQ